MGKKFRTVLNKYSYFKLSSLVLGRSRILSLPPPPPLLLEGGGTATLMTYHVTYLYATYT